MAEYIDKEAAIMMAMDYEGEGNAQDASMDIASAIGDIPAADVRENVKATWELDSDGLPVCSACGEIALQRIFVKVPHLIQDVRMVRSKWCPVCGAQMMGGAEDG